MNPEPVSEYQNFDHPGNEVQGAFILSAKHLEWRILVSDSNLELHAETGISGAANNELVTLRSYGSGFQIESVSTGELYHSINDNQENVRRITETMRYILENESAETLLKAYEDYKNEVAELSLYDTGFRGQLKRFADVLLFRKGVSVTFILALLNALIFGLMVVNGAGFIEMDTEHLLKWGANFTLYTGRGEYWRLITNTFLHGGIMHLAFNIYGLFIGGFVAESLLGKRRFLTAYLLCGIFASAVSYFMHDEVLSVGASGAIFGCFGVVLGLASTKLLAKSERNSILSGFGIFVALNLVAGLNGNIDNWAHLGGLVSGWFGGFLWSMSLSKKELVMRRKLMDVAVPVVAVLSSAVLIMSKPNSLQKFQDLMFKFDENTRKAFLFFPNDTAPDAITNQNIKDSGLHYLYICGNILKEASQIRGISARRKDFLALINKMNNARKDAFYFTFKRYENGDNIIYQDSIDEAIRHYEEAEKLTRN